MNERIRELAEQARNHARNYVAECKHYGYYMEHNEEQVRFEGKFAELIVRDCIDKIETHRIPVGNSAAGEMACEWTYAALKEIRDEIKEHFGVEK